MIGLTNKQTNRDYNFIYIDYTHFAVLANALRKAECRVVSESLKNICNMKK